jgi:hypothetical protein
MPDPSHLARRWRVSAVEYQRWSSASSIVGNFGLPRLIGLIELAGLCGIAFLVGAGVAALHLETSHFWTTEATAASDDEPQVVNRSRKDDRLPTLMIEDPSTRSTASLRGGFGMLEVGGPLTATVTVRDSKGRVVFEMDPLRHTTFVSKRDARVVPSPKEQGGPIAPKSRVVPVERPGECDPPSSRLGSGLLRLVEECHSRVRSDTKRQVSLSSPAG